MVEDRGLYSIALERIRTRFLPLQKGKRFEMNDVYRFFLERSNHSSDELSKRKKILGDVIYNITHVNKEPELEQDGRWYRLIDRELQIISLKKSGDKTLFDLVYPSDHEDPTAKFGFEDSIKLFPGDIVGIAGGGNLGKTTMCLNLAVDNMDKYKVIYFTSEFHSEKFIDRIGGFDWVNPWDENGNLRFKLARLTENFIDQIQEGYINIFDWVRMDEEQWKINALMDKVTKKLNGKGLAIISMQKRSNKNYAVGGEGSMDYASAYFTISFEGETKRNILKVEKVKSPVVGNDPNYKKYSFRLVGGAKFTDIKEEK